MRVLVLTMTMFVMTAFGGIVTMGVSADTPTEDVGEVVAEEVVNVEEDVEVEEDIEEPAEDIDDVSEDMEVIEDDAVDDSPKGIIESQTGLVVDYVKTIDSYGSWGAYYCHCDGDLYCITIKNGVVDVCVILN